MLLAAPSPAAGSGVAMSWSICINTGWLRCADKALRISSKKPSGFSTKCLASARSRSRTMAIRISSHSLGMRAGLPSCICCMIATALFSHSVRSHSSLVLGAKIELRGGHCCCAGVPSVRKKGLSGAEGGLRVLMKLTTRRMSLTRMS